jgi:hypothetical protein
MNEFSPIKQWNTTRWLVGSSLLWCIPTMYAYNHGLYLHFIVSCITTSVSVNFWRHATNSWRRDLDLVVAKVSFIFYCVYGILYIHSTRGIILLWTGGIGSLCCYHISGKLLGEHNPMWYKYHFAFHIIVGVEKIIILHHMIRHYCKENIEI